MEQKTIRLYSFPGLAPAELDITCTIARESNLLQILFRLQGDLKTVAIPPLSKRPARRHELWKNTCLEWFMAAEISKAYREFNLSPAGHWNVYYFDDYRQGMREEKAISELTVDMQRGPDRLCLGCMIDLASLGLDSQALLMGFAAVIRSIEGRSTYWASAHSGPKPDFHLRESFILKIAP